jgi:hypothetical protein
MAASGTSAIPHPWGPPDIHLVLPGGRRLGKREFGSIIGQENGNGQRSKASTFASLGPDRGSF